MTNQFLFFLYRNHIDRETQKWQKLFDTAQQKANENEQNLVDSL